MYVIYTYMICKKHTLGTPNLVPLCHIAWGTGLKTTPSAPFGCPVASQSRSQEHYSTPKTPKCTPKSTTTRPT